MVNRQPSVLASDVITIITQLCRSDPGTGQGGATGPGGMETEQVSPAPAWAHDRIGPCTAGSVELRKGDGTHLLTCSELPC